MTHLDCIQKAYDDVGITYVIRTHTDGDTVWSYLFLSGSWLKADLEQEDLDILIRQERFLEFKNGQIASY